MNITKPIEIILLIIHIDSLLCMKRKGGKNCKNAIYYDNMCTCIIQFHETRSRDRNMPSLYLFVCTKGVSMHGMKSGNNFRRVGSVSICYFGRLVFIIL